MSDFEIRGGVHDVVIVTCHGTQDSEVLEMPLFVVRSIRSDQKRMLKLSRSCITGSKSDGPFVDFFGCFLSLLISPINM